MRYNVKLLIVQITGTDVDEAVAAFAQTNREIATAVAAGTTDVNHVEKTPGGTQIRVRMKLEPKE